MPSTGLPKLLGFAFVAIASLLVDITAAAAADQFTETYLSTYRPSGRGGFSHKWVAYLVEPEKDAATKTFFVDLNDKRLGPYDRVSEFFRFSRDGEHVAFAAQKDGLSTILVDGAPKWQHQNIGFASYSWTSSLDGRTFCNQCSVANLNFSRDGSRLAYPVKDADGKWSMAVNGAPGSPYKDTGSEVDFIDGVLTYVAWPEHGIVQVHGDAVLGPFDDMGRIQISPDERHSCVVAKKTDQWIIVDGKEGSHFAEIGTCTIASDGQPAFTFRTGKGTPWQISFRGNALPGTYDEIRHVAVSDDGLHVAFWARTGTTWTVVADANKYPGFDGYYFYELSGKQYSIVWTPDSKHVAYWARKAKSTIFAVDGAERPAPPIPGVMAMIVYQDERGNLVGTGFAGGGVIDGALVQAAMSGAMPKDAPFLPFTAAGQLGYAEASKNDWFMVVGSQRQGPYKKISHPIVSDDGRHYAYVASTDSGDQLVVDGSAAGGLYQAIYHPQMLDGGRAAALGTKDGKIFAIGR
jgi:hypothetical protein